MPRTFVWHRTRGPTHTPKREAPTDGKVRITQVRSGIGHSDLHEIGVGTADMVDFLDFG